MHNIGFYTQQAQKGTAMVNTSSRATPFQRRPDVTGTGTVLRHVC